MTIIEYLSKSLFIDPVHLKTYIATCPHRYKIYSIPKRNNAGVRVIAQPAKELKILQKMVANEFLGTLPVHDACMAYREKTNIRDNALSHVKNKYLLKMDFKDFFPSIRPVDLLTHIENHLAIDVCAEDKLVIEKIFFYSKIKNGPLRLSIGAPSSPFISNTIMYDFDLAISEMCNIEGIVYTRYADDISFSTNKKDILFDFAIKIRETLEKCKYPIIKINHDKTVFLSRKGNMHITGLVLTNDGKISIGRKKKRYIKSLVHKFTEDSISEEDKNYLCGYLSFCLSVEPTFIASLEEKYGKEAMIMLKMHSRME